MIDKLVLNIPFKSEFLKWTGENSNNEHAYIPILSLPHYIPTTGNIIRNPDGSTEFEDLRTKFESLPSSHSGMAFKIFENGRNCDPFVMIKCSPAKLLQGHNVFGFDDMRKAGRNMLFLLADIYPDVFEMLDYRQTEVSEWDINYSIFVDNPAHKKLFLDHMRYVSKGQTKNRGDNYQTTVYFGSKKSRLKRLKLYSKIEEMAEDIKKMMHKGFEQSAKINQELQKTQRAQSAVRFEASILARYMQRRAIPTNFFKLCDYLETNENTYQKLFNEAWKDVIDSLSGQEIKKMNDETIYNKIYEIHHTVGKNGKIRTVKANRLFSFYQLIKSLGFDHVKKITSSSTFSRNIIDITNCGISESVLQNLKKDQGAEIIPLSTIIKIDFSNQVPDDYIVPPDLYDLPKVHYL